ncbi:MAG: AraC family transcriptional regulator [Parvibaculum sp.]|nr:AraC family transcriptional regulator [Parvibaculum sp.]
MDPLSDVLRSMRLTGGIFLRGEFTAPWCVSARVGPEDCTPFGPAPRNIIAYHYVERGGMMLRIEGQPDIEVGEGEIILLPRNDPHVLASEPGLPPADVENLVVPAADGRLSRIVFGGGGAPTGIYCGFLGNETPGDILLSVLPPVLRLQIPQDATGEWVGSTFRFAEAALAGGGERSAVVLGRLAEMLFEEAVQRHVAELPMEEKGWLAGLRDPYVGRALAILHGRPDRHWTTEDLATDVGLSRSAFASRFTDLIGAPPIRYLARWRMQMAARRLADTQDAISRIAFDTGYESEAAFNRAFKRAFGIPPAAWRKERQGPQDSPA